MSCPSPIEFTSFDSLVKSINLDSNNVVSNSTTINNVLKNLINDNSSVINDQITYYNKILNTKNNIKYLLQQYERENTILADQLKNISSDTLTNNRKTYYKDQQNDILDTYYFYLFIIYSIIFVGFVISVLMYGGGTYNMRNLALIALFIVLPFISTFLLEKIIYIMHLVYDLIPKNPNN